MPPTSPGSSTSSHSGRSADGRIEVRAQAPGDDDAIVDIMQRQNPEYPARTVEELRAMRTIVPAHSHFAELVALFDGDVSGYAVALQMFWTGEPHAYTVELAVDPARERRGVGSTLYDGLLATMQPWDARRIHTEVLEDQPASLAFAEKRGFEKTGYVTRTSRLDVERAHLDGYDGLADRLAADGITVTTLAELGSDDEDMLRQVHDTQMTAAQDEPTSEPVNVSFELWRESLLGQPGVSPETISVALADGRPIGVTMLQRRGQEAAFHFGMGVLRAYRGRGVARLLKLRQLEWARAHGVRYLYTGNDINNPRMYDINIRMGYEPLPAMIKLMKTTEGREVQQ